jgi:hypothetical protein
LRPHPRNSIHRFQALLCTVDARHCLLAVPVPLPLAGFMATSAMVPHVLIPGGDPREGDELGIL